MTERLVCAAAETYVVWAGNSSSMSGPWTSDGGDGVVVDGMMASARADVVSIWVGCSFDVACVVVEVVSVVSRMIWYLHDPWAI